MSAEASSAGGSKEYHPEGHDSVEVTTVAETDPKGGSDRPAVVLEPDTERSSFRLEGSIESYASYHGSIPVPPPYILKQYEAVHPGAVEKFFAHYDQQAAHRQKIESSVVETNTKLALKGQTFAVILGLIGLIGAFIVIERGQGAAGATVATGVVVALVSVFLKGQTSQNRELNQKAGVQAEISKTASEQPTARKEVPTQNPTLTSSKKPKKVKPT